MVLSLFQLTIINLIVIFSTEFSFTLFERLLTTTLPQLLLRERVKAFEVARWRLYDAIKHLARSLIELLRVL